jgi:hypothetical protein
MGTEDVAFALSFWPRLYLDTAELLRIGDGRCARDEVDRLVAAMNERFVILVVSIEHLQDAIPRASADTAERLADTLERFRLRAFPVRSPSDVEPWQAEQGDILLRPMNAVRSVLANDSNRSTIAHLASVQDLAHLANQVYQSARVASEGSLLSRKDHEVFLGCLVSLARGTSVDIDDTIDFWEEDLSHKLSAETRSQVRAHLVPVLILAAAIVRAKVDPDQLLREMTVGWDTNAWERSPGRYLTAQLASCRIRNFGRAPQVGDHLDGLHVSYIPYVDVATCDRQTFGCISSHLDKISVPRKAKLIRNGKLSEVIDAIEALAELPQTPPHGWSEA